MSTVMEHGEKQEYWAGVEGTIYLIHFDQPYQHAQHYLGWTQDLAKRLARHRSGNGSKLMSVVSKAGIEWRVAKVWHGDRHFERKLKNNGGLRRCCPVCGGTRFDYSGQVVKTPE